MVGRACCWVLLVYLVTIVIAAAPGRIVSKPGGQVRLVAEEVQDPCFGVCSGTRKCVLTKDGRPFCADCYGLLRRKSTGAPFAECCSYDPVEWSCTSEINTATSGTCLRSEQLYVRIPQELLSDEDSTCNDVASMPPSQSDKGACNPMFLRDNNLGCRVRPTEGGKVKCVNHDGTVDSVCRPESKFVQIGEEMQGNGSERLGYSVAMSADGRRVIIGSLLYGENGRKGRAQAYEYRDGEGWVKIGRNLIPGWSVAMSPDGGRVAVGQLLDGTVRVYDFDESEGWIQVGQEIRSSRAGWSVVFSDGGQRLAVGASNSSTDNGVASGSVRVYDLIGEEVWVQVGEAIDGESENDYSGFGLAMSSNGQRLAVGAIGNAANGSLSGHVRVYQYMEGEAAWIQLGQDIDGELMERFGWSVAMSADGGRVAIGGPFTSTVRVYDLDDASASWVQVGEIIVGPTDGSGSGVAISADGSRVVVGGQYSDANGERSGIVRVYDFVEGQGWTKGAEDITGGGKGENFGRSVAVSPDGTRVLVGAPESTTSGPGHARIFAQINSC